MTLTAVTTDSNRATLAWAAQTTFDSLPSGNPTLANVRFTGETFAQLTSTSESEEIGDRNVKGVFRNSFRMGGDLNFEMSYASHDEFYKALFQASAWSSETTVISASTDVDAADSDNSLNLGAGSWTATPAAGDWVRVAGFDTNSADFVAKVVSATSSKIVLSGVSLTTEASGDSVTVTVLSDITNGNTACAYGFEREHTDKSNLFAQFIGVMFNTLNLSVNSDGIVTGRFGCLGKQEVSPRPTATFGDGSNTPVGTTVAFNAVDHVELILEGGETFDITSLDMTFNNNLRERLKVGTGGPFELGSGKFNVSGTVRAYFEDNDQINKYLAFTSTSIAIAFKDTAGNRMIIDLPEVKLTSGGSPAQGQNQDVINDISFIASYDSDIAGTARMVRDAA